VILKVIAAASTPLRQVTALSTRQVGPLFPALPMPWRGMLTPDAGRLHGPSAAKKHLMIYDYVDSGVPV